MEKEGDIEWFSYIKLKSIDSTKTYQYFNKGLLETTVTDNSS